MSDNLGNSKSDQVVSNLTIGLAGVETKIRAIGRAWQDSFISKGNQVTSMLHGGGKGESSSKVAQEPDFSSTNKYYQTNSQGETYAPGQSTSGALVFKGAQLPSTDRYAQATPVNNNTSQVFNAPTTAWASQNKGAIAATAYNGVMAATPGVNESVTYQALAHQAMAWGQTDEEKRRTMLGWTPGLGKNRYASTMDQFVDVMREGTATSKFDAAQAYGVARQSGLAGAQNMSQLAMGAAQMSNTDPNMGIAGGMALQASMQRGRNVNFMRGIGIRIRDENGNMKPLPEIIKSLWQKICKDYAAAYGSGKKPSLKEMQIGLQPGFSMDSLISQASGGDEMLKQALANGLIAEAKTGGTFDFSKKSSESLGFTTAAISSYSQRQAEAARGLGQTAASAAAGFTQGNRIDAFFGGVTNVIDKFTGVLKVIAGWKGISETVGSGANGMAGVAGSSAVAAVTGSKASGGPVDAKVPYLVGEAGPEMFVPKSDGVIVPNHVIARKKGGSVKAGGASLSDKSSPDDFARALLNALHAPVNQDSIDALRTWERFEGGHFKNSAHYNPLNTTWKETGSTNFNDLGGGMGVQSYKSWAQGIDATVKTLQGKNSESAGYAAIIKALQGGKDKDTILAAINASKWTGHPGSYAFGGSGSEYNPGGMYKGAGGGATGGKNDVTASGGTVWGAIQDSFKNVKRAEAVTQQQSHTYNYGGVNIKVDGGNPDQIMAALQRGFAQDAALGKLGNS